MIMGVGAFESSHLGETSRYLKRMFLTPRNFLRDSEDEGKNFRVDSVSLNLEILGQIFSKTDFFTYSGFLRDLFVVLPWELVR